MRDVLYGLRSIRQVVMLASAHLAWLAATGCH